MDLDYEKIATVICPHQVNDIEYVWHPQTKSDDQSRINAYVCENGRFCSVALSDVVRTEAPRSLFRTESSESHSTLHLDLTHDDIYTIIERRLIFLCGPRDLVLSDALQQHLDRLNDSTDFPKHPWTLTNPLTQEIKKIGTGLGMLILYRGLTHLPLQGCGSRPSPLFAVDNEVTVDPNTGIRSCLADPMLKAPIGFLCEGRLEPDDCMRSLLNNHGGAITAPSAHKYWEFEHHEPWVVAQYFKDLALPPFSGECRCINPETGQVKAKIQIRPKTEYSCDISSNIFRNRVRPIRGPWCSVVLHPGSALTIMLPIQNVYPQSFEVSHTVSFSQMMSLYAFETEFAPKDLTTLRQLIAAGDINAYDEIPYHEALAGDALELNVSRISQGEVKLKYHLDKPLALREGINSFVYNWALRSRNENLPTEIRAIVQVSFAFTHEYAKVGCDRGQRNVFDQLLSGKYCTNKPMGNGIGETYECAIHIRQEGRYAGIYCGTDEDLLPDNCETAGYDMYSNRITPFPVSLQNSMPYPIRRFQLFYFGFISASALSYACICVNKHGYETSKLILVSDCRKNYNYVVRRKNAFHWLLAYMSLPWRKVGLLIERPTSTAFVILHHTYKKEIKLHVGTVLSMTCEMDTSTTTLKEGENDDDSNCEPETSWIPMHSDVYYYSANHTKHGTELFRMRYRDSIVTTPGGFGVVYGKAYAPEYQRLIITSPRYGVLISKDPLHKKYVPMTFVCGKVPEQLELSISTDDPTTSQPSADSIRQATIWSGKYTWNVVQVQAETTDPYMQGCGVTYASDELFKPETPQLYDADGQPQFGCKIDLQAAKEAAFYCPAPYVLDPPNCFSQVAVEGTVKNTRDLSKSLVSSRSNHFVIVSFDSSLEDWGDAAPDAAIAMPLRHRQRDRSLHHPDRELLLKVMSSSDVITCR
ncbi:hypothetical protein, conserved [Babesia ovata]|uniref:6-Cys domain-containing protein n=1 Tax=Babesia ovata TaxID=189622 RepID=A0A2H6KEA4_9APIC|nr:uncharacterized protein BOVATA_028160 [Babesia ovata]GBE61323.1 hypothetical protein, conserved [Babesia ovata]